MATPATVSALHKALSVHTRSNDKHKLVDSLSKLLSTQCISLEPVPAIDPAISLQDVSRERVILNNVPFLSVSSGINHQFLEAIYELCEKICDMDEVFTLPQELVEGLMSRMARSGSGADSYFKLNSLLGSPDLMIMPRNREGSKSMPPPITLDVYVSGGNIHADISCTNMYGLYRKADLKGINASREDGENPAWINVDAIVEEKINFGNGQSVRFLKVKFPKPTPLTTRDSRRKRGNKYLLAKSYSREV